MPMYRCEIINKKGKKETRLIKANDENSLKAQVKLDKCFLLKATIAKEKGPNTFFAVSSRVKSVEVAMFLRQFSVLIHSGATISESLFTLKNQKHSKAFTKVLQEVYADVLAGQFLSYAFRRHPKVFPNYFCGMIEIGEASGALDNVLMSLADYYENDRKIKSKAKTAMVYPIFLLVMIVAVVAFMTLYILPQFQSMIDELGSDVPLITKIVMGISHFVQNNILGILVFIIALILVLIVFFRTKPGKITKDWLKLHFPFIGRINKNLVTARFARAFIILLESGMHITACLDNLSVMIDNSLLQKRFEVAKDRVEQGIPVNIALRDTKIFPPILTEMIAVGEKSGNMESVLRSSLSYFDQQVEASITRATTALEPIMIVILGVVVGVVILAVFLPMISLYQSI